MSNASAQMASARVIEPSVAGLNARSLIGASISLSNCSFSRGMMFCRWSVIASSARPSSPLSLRRRYKSCETALKSSSDSYCVSTKSAKHFSNDDAPVCPFTIFLSAPASLSRNPSGASNPALTDSFTAQNASHVTNRFGASLPGQ